ncbi:IS1249 family transposase [Brevibacterium moorei]|uniref:IS1249 family transposase n=1 Tax=Brevibacterium moorei TaxID=2968457 RepID=UPI00211C045C|nr:IS1249 family transposase [Brevibacterium sp. 68QC2CO]MCQ9384533.1 IS1249 family transposase [Brevibacterium sp. 68QC2CO]
MICSAPLKKNGTTSAGKTRYRCTNCGASTTPKRSPSTRRHELNTFLDWLLGPAGRTHHNMPARTLRRTTAWCWNVEPTPPASTGEIHSEIFLDGTYFNGWCVLIASTRHTVIDWQFCDKEKTASWTALIERIPAPDYAIVDGNGPLNTVIGRYWPHTRVQRCLFHIRHDIHRHLTRKPTLEANKELLALVKTIKQVDDADEAAAWLAEFAAWEARHASFLKHRTYARSGAARPAYVKPTQMWWYTHQRTRRAHKLLAGLIRKNHLFTWIEAAQKGKQIARATSVLEGGFNQPIKDLLRRHRGMTGTHAKTAMAWWLHMHTRNPATPFTFAKPPHWTPARRQACEALEEPIGPAAYDTHFSPEDGNGIQQGWGGRTR